MLPSKPPQTIISLPVHTALWSRRALGAPLVAVDAPQLSVAGLYRPPVPSPVPPKSAPPQMIISLPVHTAVCPLRALGTTWPRLAQLSPTALVRSEIRPVIEGSFNPSTGAA